MSKRVAPRRQAVTDCHEFKGADEMSFSFVSMEVK